VNGRRERGRCPLLLAALAVLAALLLLAALLPWWSQWRADLERAAVTEARVARYRSLVDSRAELEKALDEIAKRVEAQRYFIEAANLELAAAGLQQRIKTVVAEAGGTLVSTRNLSGGQRETGGNWIRIEVRMKGDTATLARVLLALRRERPVELVEALTVRGRALYRKRGNRMETTRRQELEIGFRVTARLQGNAS
jgi:General secretion pathway protein M.